MLPHFRRFNADYVQIWLSPPRADTLKKKEPGLETQNQRPALQRLRRAVSVVESLQTSAPRSVCSLGTNIFHGQSWLGPTISIQSICHINLVIYFVEGKSSAKLFSFKSGFLHIISDSILKITSELGLTEGSCQRKWCVSLGTSRGKAEKGNPICLRIQLSHHSTVPQTIFRKQFYFC